MKTEMAISLLELDCIRYSVNRDETLTVLDFCWQKLLDSIACKIAYDQTWIPPSLASPVQMMRISCSPNLMMHFFCSLSTDCTISTGTCG